MKLNNWTKDFPDPGPCPPRPDGEAAPLDNLDAYREWNDKFRAHNDWILSNCRHLVAKALDALEAKHAYNVANAKKGKATLEAVEIIALVVGTDYLQGHSAGVLGLFGGLL